jgi:hypothetical protein
MRYILTPHIAQYFWGWQKYNTALSDSAQHKLQESLIEFFNREAVATQSPGLPRFGGYPGKGTDKRSNPNGVAPRTNATNKSRVKTNRRNLFEVGNLHRSIPHGSRQSAATLGSESQPLRGL